MNDSVPDQSVAIIGMAAHLPGAMDVGRFWDNLCGGVESIARLSDEALLAAGVPTSDLADPRYVKAAALLDGMTDFDAGFFGFSPRDAAVMDPQTRHFLECAWHALEHASHVPERFDGPIGVFAGAGAAQYFWRNVVADPALLASVGYFLLRHTGNDKDFVATRASYELNLTGPSVGVQTACSSSLVATHLACQSLLSFECDLALAGGVTIEQPHVTGYRYISGEILSPDGHCRPFDHRAQGTVFGSGAGVVVLRRLQDALDDGDTIHAVILGSAVNNDGAGKVSYLAPSVDGHAKAVTEALSAAGVTADTIGFVEAHGTGTPIGDPIEVAALTQAFRASAPRIAPAACALGSVKSNLGHLDTAAGVASLIKASLAVRDGRIPPTLHFERPNPLLQLDASPFFVNDTLAVWPLPIGPRRAGISSLGVGGTNAHVIVQQPPAQEPSGPSRAQQLLVLSARSATALDDATRQLVEYLEAASEPDLAHLADTAHTLRLGRRRFSHRRAVVCATAEQAIENLATGQGASLSHHVTDAARRPVAFLFAGGGMQYPNMGRTLYEREAVFREAADACFDHARTDTEFDFDLRSLLYGDAALEATAAETLRRPSRALPVLFTVQYAQARLWMSWGIQPSALLGHSMGEYTAACLAGVMSPDDALSLVALRGRLFETLPPGAMLSVGLGEAPLRRRLPDALSIAALNAPEASVVAGPTEAIAAFAQSLTADGVPCRRIHIDVAAHSAMLQPILGPFAERIARLRLRSPTRTLISNLTGAPAGDEVTRPDYWVRHLRETVRFADGLGQLTGPDGPLLLEVGPGHALRTLARMHPGFDASQLATSSMPAAGEAGCAQAAQLHALGELWTHGAEPDWAAFSGDERRLRIPLPAYPFERRSYFVEPPAREGSPKTAASGAQPSDTVRRDDPTRWFQQRTWVPTPLPAPVTELSGEPVILALVDPGGLGEALAARLRKAGAKVIEVHAAAAPSKPMSSGAGVHTLRAGSAADWRALIDTLHAEGALPQVVVHAWCLDRAPAADARSLPALQDRALLAPLHLLQALQAVAPTHPLRFVAVTSGALETGDESTLQPAHALLLGPVRVAPAELPGLGATLIEVGRLPQAPRSREHLVDRLLAELAAPSSDLDERVVALRGAGPHGDRLAERFVDVPLPTPAIPALAEGAVVLITGGTGGLGLTIARDLARTEGARLALVGRHADTIPLGVRAGAGVGDDTLWLAADVTDASRMAEVVREVIARFGRLDVVLHAAGVLDDGPLLGRTPEQLACVLAPKVRGTEALWQALQVSPPEVLVLFSSVSAVVGAPGQLDYAAANSYLDTFARAHAADGPTRVVSVAWGAWKDVGMAARLAGATAPLAAAIHGPQPGLFDQQVATQDGGLRLSGTLYKDRHWMLAEHRLRDGDWLLPGSGYVELLRGAFQQARPGAPFRVADLIFLRPLHLGVDEVRELELCLSPEAAGFSASFRSRARASAAWEEHATARLGSETLPTERPEPLAEVIARLGEPAPTPRAAHPMMDFGPRWDNVRAEANRGAESLLRHALAPEFRGDVAVGALHPALLDMATAGALHLIELPAVPAASEAPTSADDDHFFVPAGYGGLRLYAPLPAELYSHIRRRESDTTRRLVSFDVTLYDLTGQVLATVSAFSMVRVPRAALQPSAPADHSLPDWLRDAIAPADGVDALRRVLAQPTSPHVFVAPRSVQTLVTQARSRRAPHAPKPRLQSPSRVLRPEVARALEQHEAVAEAAALGEAGEGQGRVVAFVVYAPDGRTTVSELRRFVRERVGQDAVPQNFVEMVALPRGPDGAILASALRDPLAATSALIAPRTPTERTIAAIWVELLGLEEAGIHDNFLDAGGHSLVGIRVLSRIHQQTGVRLEANALTMQTLEQLAAEVDRLALGASPAPAPEQRAGLPDTPSSPEPSPTARPGLLARLRHTLGGT